jgi:UDPglucose--hexose-1-phosphate uridylyltransferase
VPNKYPALTTMPTVAGEHRAGRYREFAAEGRHEVVIDTPQHNARLSRFSLSQLEALLAVFRVRRRHLGKLRQVKSVLIFRNEGREAGASQEHPHSQIVALPFVPVPLKSAVSAALRHFRRQGCCLTCDLMASELRDRTRLVAANSQFAAFTHFAPRFPYELCIVPRRHRHDFGAISDAAIRHLASLLRTVAAAVERVCGQVPLNLILHTAPVVPQESIEDAFHWRMDLVPRLSVPSGLELGHGVFIVSIAPETAAASLRASIS